MDDGRSRHCVFARAMWALRTPNSDPSCSSMMGMWVATRPEAPRVTMDPKGCEVMSSCMTGTRFSSFGLGIYIDSPSMNSVNEGSDDYGTTLRLESAVNQSPRPQSLA